MIENLIGGLILSLLLFLVVYFYLKNKKEGKDNYDGLNDGSGGGNNV
jgi:Tfp pilus assembly protein PilW